MWFLFGEVSSSSGCLGWATWYGVDSYSSQFVLKSIRTHFGQFVLSLRSIRTHFIKFSKLVLILVDLYSVWSIRTHTKNIILMIYIILLMIDR